MEKTINKTREKCLCMFGISAGIFLLGIIEMLTLIDFTYSDDWILILKKCIQFIPYVIMTVWLAVDKHKNRESNSRTVVTWALLAWLGSLFASAFIGGGHLQPSGVATMFDDIDVDSDVFETISIYIILIMAILMPYLRGRVVQAVTGIFAVIYTFAIIYQVAAFFGGERAMLFWCIMLLANICYYIGIILCAREFNAENSSCGIWRDLFETDDPDDEYDEYAAYGDKDIPPLFRISKEEYDLICARRIERFDEILARMNEDFDYDDELDINDESED